MLAGASAEMLEVTVIEVFTGSSCCGGLVWQTSSGRHISRAEIIRGIIDAAELTPTDLSEANSAEGIVAIFAAWRAGRR